MFGSNASSLSVGEGIEHAMMRVDRGQSVLGQLVIDKLNNLGHSCFIITPVTNNLYIAIKHNIVSQVSS